DSGDEHARARCHAVRALALPALERGAHVPLDRGQRPAVTHTLQIFVLRRLAGAIAFVVVVSSTALLLIRLAPGDASTDMKMNVADPSVIVSEQVRLGLDRSPLAQLGSWLAGLARFDLGTSSRFGRPVSGLVAERVWNTAILAGLALVIATVLGI